MSKALKKQLILQCKATVGNDMSGRRPLNIAVIGPPGCGKSSFLNTMFASFKISKKGVPSNRTCWKEIAMMGDYGEHDIQETSRLRIYPKEAYIEDDTNRVLMPTFIDVTGMEDEESEINKEMLSLFFNGKLKDGEDLNSVRQFYFNNGRNIHTLRQFYNKRSENTKVDRIIVVCTANRTLPLPKYLLTAIRTTARIGSREIPIYGILTNADKQLLIDPQYIERQTRFRNHLGLVDIRFKCISNYCADTDPTGSYISTTLPYLDIPVLELMTQVLCPRPGDPTTPYSNIFWIAPAVAIIIILLAILLMMIKS